ncbi:hypothetical protein AAF712_008981 [Marasmius tenuissimus]|uniref:G domain-containing protein n=1 Tax=Marasmius tenuissimus TaxID=585030 RepID=A0ABR2ZRA9_9AGAR
MSRSDTTDSRASTVRARGLSSTSTNTSQSLVSSPRPESISHLSITSDSATSVADEVLSQNAVDDVLSQCPKFRILVLGKSGAGKSSLINSTFNVNVANVSHELAGVSDINSEITSEQNSRFILHDSQGFAHGEVDNFKTVEKFIRDRTDEKKPLKDRLHAIWFCVEIPTANGALFEKGEEKIFELKLENVPIIVVFTKYDELVSKLEEEIDSELEEDGDDLDDDQFQQRVEERARSQFSEICVKPLKAITKDRELPFLEVSTRKRYKSTLEELMHLTRGHVDEAVWLTWAIAQRTSADLKIDASIAIGRKKYWKGLASGLNLAVNNLKAFMNVVHDEIVTIWNFNDPKMHCRSPEFKALMSHLVEDLSDQPPMEHMRKLISVTGLTGIVTSAVPGAVVVALPVAAGLVFAQWFYMAYRASPSIIRLLMGYIIDLVLVMQSLFWIVQVRGEGETVTKHLLRLAIEAYGASENGELTRIHNAIASFATPTSLFKFGHKDLVLAKVEELITDNKFRIPPRLQEHVKSIPESILNDPEEWFFSDPIGYMDYHRKQAPES